MVRQASKVCVVDRSQSDGVVRAATRLLRLRRAKRHKAHRTLQNGIRMREFTRLFESECESDDATAYNGMDPSLGMDLDVDDQGPRPGSPGGQLVRVVVETRPTPEVFHSVGGRSPSASPPPNGGKMLMFFTVPETGSPAGTAIPSPRTGPEVMAV